MRFSPETRAVRKAAQLSRLEKKGDDNYPQMYASQPVEIRKAAEQGAQRKAIADAKRAIEVSMSMDAQGSIEVFGGVHDGKIAASIDIVNDASAGSES